MDELKKIEEHLTKVLTCLECQKKIERYLEHLKEINARLDKLEQGQIELAEEIKNLGLHSEDYIVFDTLKEDAQAHDALVKMGVLPRY